MSLFHGDLSQKWTLGTSAPRTLSSPRRDLYSTTKVLPQQPRKREFGIGGLYRYTSTDSHKHAEAELSIHRRGRGGPGPPCLDERAPPLCLCPQKGDQRRTMPSRVSQGAADFEETLFIRSHVYYTPGSGAHIDAEELDFGKKTVDLSGLIQESIEKSFEGTIIRQWNTTFSLSGKAKGGELVLKLGFQIMEKDGGIGIYTHAEGDKSGNPGPTRLMLPESSQSHPSVCLARGQRGAGSEDFTMDYLNLDEPAPHTTPPPDQAEANKDDNDILDFEVEDKGVEIQDEGEESSVSSEVVKEVVEDESHLTRLTELDSIAQQIKALESMMGDEKALKLDDETESQALDADEDKVTREFRLMLEGNEDEDDESKFEDARVQAEIFLPDLGKGLGFTKARCPNQW